jgi:hypothetical protein
MQKPPSEYVYALASYSVKRKGDKFYIKHPHSSGWSKPYKTLRHAVLAIAILLQREWYQRHAKRCEYHVWDAS